MLHLQVIAGDESHGKELYTDGATVSIGRAAECDLVLKETSVSRHHGEITLAERMIYKDHNSSNGSRIIRSNGRAIELGPLLAEHELQIGDVLEVGAVQLAVHMLGAESRFNQVHAEYTISGNLYPIPMAQGDGPDGAILSFLNLPHLHSADVRESVESLAKRISQALPYASCAAVALMRDSTVANESITSEDLDCVGVHRSEGGKASVSVSIMNEVRQKKAAICFSRLLDNLPESESVADADISSCLCAPLVDQRGVFGFVQVHIDGARAKSFGQRELHVVSVIAGIASLLLQQIRAVRREAELRTFASVGQVVAGMSHDAKNILVSLGAASASLQREFTQLAESKKWSDINKDMEFLRFLVQDTWSRIGTHKRRPAPRDVALAALVDSMAERCQRYFVQESERGGILLRNHIPPELTIRTDPDLLSVALFNGIKNAIDAYRYAPVPPDVALVQFFATGSCDGNVKLSIVDDAGGIPAAIRTRIGGELISTKGEMGSGLGARILLEAVARLGGSALLATATEDPSQMFPPGTCLTLELPRQLPNNAADPHSLSFELLDEDVYAEHRRAMSMPSETNMGEMGRTQCRPSHSH